MRQETAFCLSVHLACSTALGYYLAGGVFGSSEPTQYPPQQSQLKASEEDLAPAFVINCILKYAPLSVSVPRRQKVVEVQN